MYRGALLVVMLIWGSVYAAGDWMFEGKALFTQLQINYLRPLLLQKVKVDDAVARGWDVSDSRIVQSEAIERYTAEHGKAPDKPYWHWYNRWTHQIQSPHDWVNTWTFLKFINKLDDAVYYLWMLFCFLGAVFQAHPIIEGRKAAGINNFADIGGRE